VSSTGFGGGSSKANDAAFAQLDRRLVRVVGPKTLPQEGLCRVQPGVLRLIAIAILYTRSASRLSRKRLDASPSRSFATPLEARHHPIRCQVPQP
jgi:hypothetical protein